jgi:hypothetical protein
MSFAMMHPIETLSGTVNAVLHPIDTYKIIAKDIEDTFQRDTINHITLKCVFYVFCYDLISIDWM